VRVSRRTRAALIAAGVLLIFFLLVLVPSSPVVLDPGGWNEIAARTVAGGYHVHSSRSDGAADKPAIAHAAARAGLRFLILTDHGDATRPPDPPAYIEGVLCLDAVEISTDDGHYVAMDMPRSPYPLGGAAATVVEDVARLGGFGIAAHPDSPKESLRWTDNDSPIDGLEWLNGDSEWRNESRLRLWRAAAGYIFRPGSALTTLLDRPVTLDRWDRLTVTRRVVALAGLDAHGGIGRRLEDGSRSNIPGIPSYAASFSSLSVKVELDRALSGDAAADGHAVFAAIRGGRVYTTIDGLARNGLLEFHAEAAGQRIPMGGAGTEGADVTLVARALKPAGAQLVLLEGGRERASSSTDLRVPANRAGGAYRVEVRLPGAPGVPPVPWIVGNPIYFLKPAVSKPVEPLAGKRTPIPASEWQIEKDPGSGAILRTPGGRVELEYSLKRGDRASQYVAIATGISGNPIAGVEMNVAADRPSRISVQLRDQPGHRWGSSVYVSGTAREVATPLSAFHAIADAPDAPTNVSSVLVVVDLTNASPGRTGTLTINRAAFVR
jgi:hypothetical protein